MRQVREKTSELLFLQTTGGLAGAGGSVVMVCPQPDRNVCTSRSSAQPSNRPNVAGTGESELEIPFRDHEY